MKFIDKCLSEGGIPQWGDDGVRFVCAKPRKVYDQPVEILIKENLEPMQFLGSEKEKLVRYFQNVYPSTSLAFWKNLSIEKLEEMYSNLEIWYDFPGTNDPSTPKSKRAAKMMPFYRVPDSVDLQQFVDKKPQRSSTWMEVYHSGPMNTDFYIPTGLFAGTYYYPAKGSGVFLPLGKTLIAYNKVHALKKLRVPNDVILENSGPSFKRWYTREIKRNGGDEKTALNSIISEMVKGKNSTKDSKGQYCYFGLSDQGDPLMAYAAIQQGYDSIQLIREAQKGCSPDGVLVGFELIHLRAPGESAKMLRRLVPDEYLVNQMDEQIGAGMK